MSMTHCTLRGLALTVAWLAGILLQHAFAQSGETPPTPERDAPFDEAQGGRTLAGHAVTTRSPDDFPAERRDVFELMDQRATNGSTFAPLALTREQIQGRNTWLLWAGGNEAFWNWLQQHGYGFVDFLKLIDSESRAQRFHVAGLVNQPGMAPRAGPGPWGLRIDEVIAPLAHTNGLDHTGKPWPVHVDDQGRALQSDGVNPAVFGYPSGVRGLRLFPNPDSRGQALPGARRMGTPSAPTNTFLATSWRACLASSLLERAAFGAAPHSRSL